MTSQKRIESVKISARQMAGGPADEVVPAWVPPLFKRAYRYTRDLAKKFNKSLANDHEEDLVKKTIESFRHM